MTCPDLRHHGVEASTSNDQRERDRAEQVTKSLQKVPVDASGFVELVKSVHDRW